MGNAEAAEGTADAPRVELSALGQRVEACWKAIGTTSEILEHMHHADVEKRAKEAGISTKKDLN